MKKHLLLIIGIFFLTQVKSQSFPYLNASTGNENEFPVDKDTNIFMFHGNRLVKTDKNFNTVWAKTYSGFTFASLLLSKTGSMYFIGRVGSSNTCYGKISSNGNVSWIKNTQIINAVLSGTTSTSYAVDCKRLLLDKNNNLLISGHEGLSTPFTKGFLIKTDTNGNNIKLKCFNPSGGNYCNNLTILSDSAGYYKFIGSAYAGMGPAIQLVMHTYNDNLDVFSNNKSIYYINIPYGFEWRLVKSKFGNSFYIQTSTQTSIGYVMAGMAKFGITGQLKWDKEMSKIVGSMSSLYAFSQHMEESNNGDLFYTMSTSNSSTFYTSAFLKLDSNGVLGSSNASAILSGYNMGSTMAVPNNAARVIHNNNYYFDVWGVYFPSNPLTVQKFNSSLTLPCSALISYSILGTPNYSLPVSAPSIAPITSYTIPSFTSSATAVSFSVNTNFCLVMGQNELINNSPAVTLFPNPTQNTIQINLSSDYSVEEIKVYDINGKNIGIYNYTTSINVSELPQGIYFLKIKTDRGEVNRKFVKE